MTTIQGDSIIESFSFSFRRAHAPQCLKFSMEQCQPPVPSCPTCSHPVCWSLCHAHKACGWAVRKGLLAKVQHQLSVLQADCWEKRLPLQALVQLKSHPELLTVEGECYGRGVPVEETANDVVLQRGQD